MANEHTIQPMVCACLQLAEDLDEVVNHAGSIPLGEFTQIRNQCPALREVLLPDTIWQGVLHRLNTEDSVAGHTSVSLLAFLRSGLKGITEPIHRFLLTNSGMVDPRVRNQYLQDLQEKWLLDADPARRHSLCRIFRGRIVELQFASWLEFNGQTVNALEAWREGADIQTLSQSSGSLQNYEVKFIGLEDTDFALLLAESGDWISPYVALNYLLFRIYEAANSLSLPAVTARPSLR